MKNSKKLLIFFCVGFFLLAVCGAQGVKEELEPVKIEIKVKEGEIICPYDEAEFDQVVIWHSDYAFAIDFGKATPFMKFKFHSSKKDKEERSIVEEKVVFKGAKNTKKTWKFKYWVAVLYEGKILTLDPELGIKP